MAVLDDTQQRLLDAAGEIFAEKGFQAATIREISQRAEVNIAAINYHFGDKERLYIEAVKTAFGASGNVEPESWPSGLSPDRKLTEFIHQFMARLIGGHGPSWHMRLVARELTTPTDACLAFVRDFARPSFERVLDILDEVLPAGTPPDQRHLVAISIIGQCVHHRCARTIVGLLVGEDEFATYDASRLAAHIAEFSLAAIGLRPPHGSPFEEASR